MHEVGDRDEVREVQFVNGSVLVIAVAEEDLSRGVIEAASLSLRRHQRAEPMRILESRHRGRIDASSHGQLAQ